jgi:hypothetical protein
VQEVKMAIVHPEFVVNEHQNRKAVLLSIDANVAREHSFYILHFQGNYGVCSITYTALGE